MKRLIGALVICLMLAGCPSGTNQQKIAVAVENAAISLQGIQQGEIAAYNDGQACLASATDKSTCIVIPASDHQFIQQQFLSLSAIGKTTDSCIKTATTNNGWIQCTTTAVNGINTINQQGGLYLKSDKAKSEFTLAITSISSALQTVATILGGQ